MKDPYEMRKDSIGKDSMRKDSMNKIIVHEPVSNKNPY